MLPADNDDSTMMMTLMLMLMMMTMTTMTTTMMMMTMAEAVHDVAMTVDSSFAAKESERYSAKPGDKGWQPSPTSQRPPAQTGQQHSHTTVCRWAANRKPFRAAGMWLAAALQRWDMM